MPPLLLLLLLLRPQAAVVEEPQARRHQRRRPVHTLRLLPVGDITTAVAGPAHTPQQGALPTYRMALWQLLRRHEQLQVQFVGSITAGDVPGASREGQRHEGHANYRADQIARALPAWLGAAYTELNIDVAVVWVGMQDIKSGKSPEKLLEDFTGLVNVLHERPGSNTTTLVCTLPKLPLQGSYRPEFTDSRGQIANEDLLAHVDKFNDLLPGWAARLETKHGHPVRVVDVNKQIYTVSSGQIDAVQAWVESKRIARAIYETWADVIGGQDHVAMYRRHQYHRSPNHPTKQFQMTFLRMVILLLAPFGFQKAISVIQEDAAEGRRLQVQRSRQRLLQAAHGLRFSTARDSNYTERAI